MRYGMPSLRDCALTPTRASRNLAGERRTMRRRHFNDRATFTETAPSELVVPLLVDCLIGVPI